MSDDMIAAKRTACGPDEIPRWALKLGKGSVNLSAHGRMFKSTNHLTVRVETLNGATNEKASKKIESSRWTEDAFPAADIGRAFAIKGLGERGYKHGCVVCNVGAVRVNLKYVLLVERLFPGCTWAAPDSARKAPVQAIVDGVIVALIAGQTPDSMGGTVGEDPS